MTTLDAVVPVTAVQFWSGWQVFDPQIIFAIVGGLVAGVVIRRLWQQRVNTRDERLREMERAAIEDSKRAEQRERRAAGPRSRKRSRQREQS